MAKNLYIISGCNGAGKTTASFTLLPKIWECKEFVNADEIARGLSPFNNESVAIEAGRIMLGRIDALLEAGVSFSIETTLSTRFHRKLALKARGMGYVVQLCYLWLDTPQMAIERVAKRVSEGGHNIPEETIVRRYYAGLHRFFDTYMDCVDYWLLVDNSVNPRTIVAEKGPDGQPRIYQRETYNRIKERLAENDGKLYPNSTL